MYNTAQSVESRAGTCFGPTTIIMASEPDSAEGQFDHIKVVENSGHDQYKSLCFGI